MNNVRILLKNKGMSQIKLASLLQVSDAAVSKWCNWDVKIPEHHIKAMAVIFDCKCNEVTGKTNVKDS